MNSDYGWYLDEDVDKILTLKLSLKAHQDLLGWQYNENGIYSVKSGYWLGTHLPSYDRGTPIPGNDELKQRLWKIKAPTKIKHFLWRLLTNSLATGTNLKR